MGDGAAERTSLCSLGVEVDPLVIASCVGELLNPLLRDRDPVAVAEVGSDKGREGVKVGDDGRHGVSLSGWRQRYHSRWWLRL